MKINLFFFELTIRRSSRFPDGGGPPAVENPGTAFPTPDEYAQLQDALNKDELREIRKQARDHLYQRFAQTTKIYTEQMHQQRISAFNSSKDFAVLTVRSLFILNGAAILALLTFISSFFTKGGESSILIGITITKGLIPSLYCFSAGLVCASVIAALGYLNYGVVYMTYMTEGELYRLALHDEWVESGKHWEILVKITVWVAAILGILGLAFFIYGALNAARSFTMLTP